MSETKHTPIPGGWEIIEDNQGFLNIHTARELGEEDLGPADIVATCYQDEPYARLIAAAPDLLAALKFALPYAKAELEVMREHLMPPGWKTTRAIRECVTLWNGIEAAEAAIAKAE